MRIYFLLLFILVSRFAMSQSQLLGLGINLGLNYNFRVLESSGTGFDFVKAERDKYETPSTRIHGGLVFRIPVIDKIHICSGFEFMDIGYTFKMPFDYPPNDPVFDKFNNQAVFYSTSYITKFINIPIRLNYRLQEFETNSIWVMGGFNQSIFLKEKKHDKFIDQITQEVYIDKKSVSNYQGKKYMMSFNFGISYHKQLKSDLIFCTDIFYNNALFTIAQNDFIDKPYQLNLQLKLIKNLSKNKSK